MYSYKLFEDWILPWLGVSKMEEAGFEEVENRLRHTIHKLQVYGNKNRISNIIAVYAPTDDSPN